MKLMLDLSKEYGIVLEGGGAKGAYQIGAWRAFREVGVRIKGVSGVSVGALNGAMICMDDVDKALEIWENITYSQVMDVEDGLMDEVIKGSLKNYNIADIMKEGIRILGDGGMDITPLKNLINEAVDEGRIRESLIDLFVITYSVSDHKLLEVDVKEAPEGLIGDMLLASAYFLAFKNKKLHGKKYMDGGGWNNVPLNALIERNYKDIIVLRIYGLGVDTERRTVIPEDVNIYHVAPRQNLGHILEFDSKKSKKNMMTGYYDAMRMLYGLVGKRYYLDAAIEEGYYFNKIVLLAELEWDFLLELGSIENKGRLVGCRVFMELIVPKLVVLLKLKKGWDYRELYLRVLEEAAMELKIARYKIYTDVELLMEVVSKLEIFREDGGECSIYMLLMEAVTSLTSE